MKLSITMISFSDKVSSEKMSVKEFIELSSSYGVDAVDIVGYYWQDREREIPLVREALKKHGLEVGAYCIGNKFVLPSREEIEKQVEHVKDGIDTAVKLGTKHLRIFGGSTADAPDMDQQTRLKMAIDGIKECISYAEEKGITMVLENHGGIPAKSSEAKMIVEAVNSPNLKLLFDIGNFPWYAGEDPVKAALALYPYVAHIHVKDLVPAGGGGAKYEGCITGEGVVPVKECLKTLKEHGYDGFVTLEYEAWPRMESYQGVKKSLEYLKKVLSDI